MSEVSDSLDLLSPLAHRLIKLGSSEAYALPVVRGGGNVDARAALEMVKPDELISVPVRRVADARAMLAGLWLWHDWLDASHDISQSIESPTGSFWHAILHRREGDFSNSKYWYRRTGTHPMFSVIAANIGAVLNHLPADKSLLRLTRGGWDPDAFVDLAQALDRRPDDERLHAFADIQRLEWRTLFDHCARQASGS